jgi:hypothetical protein
MNANEPTREQAIAKATEYMAKATSFLMFTYDEEGAHAVQWSGEPDGQTYFDEMGAAIGACCYGTAGYGLILSTAIANEHRLRLEDEFQASRIITDAFRDCGQN